MLLIATGCVTFPGRRYAMDKIAVKKTPRDKVVSGPYMWVDAVLVDASNVDKFLK